ncbi:MAG: Ig-like domain-containing protein [Clostridia bacterium]|nr:Ig-like domain-containing protein [Clostridia bacterium]
MKKLLSIFLAVLMAFSVVSFTVSAEETAEPEKCTHKLENGDLAGVWEVKLEPTCTESGIKVFRCTLCDEVEVQPIYAGHIYNKEVTVEPSCSGEGYTGIACSVCGDVKDKTNVVPALPHEYSEWTDKLAPTCLETGSRERTCLVCSNVETEAIPALGHDYKDTVVAPNYEVGGYTLHECNRCGHSFKDTETEKLTGRVESLELGDKITMSYGASQPIDLSGLKIGGDVKYTVAYKSSAENVAVIDENGNITAKGMGSAKITVTVTDEYNNIVEDTVDIKVNFSILDWFKIIGSILMAAIEIVIGGLDFSAIGELFK